MSLEIKEDLRFLRKKSKKVDQITDEIRSLVDEMGEAMEKNGGVGLAAPQVGILKRIIVIKSEGGFSCFINPRIIKKSGKKETAEEGCLSIPDRYLPVKRFTEIKIEFLNLEGQKKVLNLEGFLARVFQHEADHLEGILILDRISFLKKIGRILKK